jgi:probable HAF family extracellular repeat protein
MTDIGTLAPNYSADAYGINNLGQIVGEANSPTAAYHAFRYSNGVMQDLGVLPGGRTSTGTAINNLGHVAGHADNSLRNDQAFLWTGSTLADLGTLGGSTSWANGINNLDHVVGWSLVSPSVQHAFLYSGGTMQDLNSLIDPSSGWKLTNATAINDLGEIVGQGTDPQGHASAFLLTPTPEPGAITPFSLLASGLLIRRRGQGRSSQKRQ